VYWSFIADGIEIWQVCVIYPIKTGLTGIEVECMHADMSIGVVGRVDQWMTFITMGVGIPQQEGQGSHSNERIKIQDFFRTFSAP